MTNPPHYRLRAGPLELTFEAGGLRYLRLGPHDVLARIYAAVRDENWGTVEGELSEVQLEQRPDSFHLSFTSTHRAGDVHFVWQGVVTGEANGTLLFTFDGTALSTFCRNRVGFCVLHPLSAAGAACVITHTDGGVSETHFPEAISPHQPFKAIRAVAHELAPGVWAQATLTGDTFEMEDQRNWTDASFKTYCTPLGEPFPVRVERGARVRQSVRLELRGAAPYVPEPAETPSVQLLGEHRTLPSLGLGAGSEPQTAWELEQAKGLNLAHLRLDLDLQGDYEVALARKTHEARLLGCALELALHLSDRAEGELRKVAGKLRALTTPVARYLVFRKGEPCADSATLELARRLLPAAPLVGGTDGFFTDLNRARPATDALDAVAYSLTPQVHAFDDASLVETLPVQALTVTSATRFCAGKPVVLSPVTFKMRHNPAAAGVFPLEAQLDPRQRSLFGAAWTLGSLKGLFGSDVASLTYFELSGPLGVLRGGVVSGEVYPAYHVFADVGEFRGGEIILCRSSQPLQFEALLLRHAAKERLILANFGEEPKIVTLHGLTGPYRGRSLDHKTEREARLEPARFRATYPLTFGAAGTLDVRLEPHALLTLDAVR